MPRLVIMNESLFSLVPESVKGLLQSKKTDEKGQRDEKLGLTSSRVALATPKLRVCLFGGGTQARSDVAEACRMAQNSYKNMF